MKTDLRITTPTLRLDADICRQNIDRMHDKMRKHGVDFRPHFKTHQSRAIGSWFRDLGVEKITVSSLGMARYFAEDGWQDITVAFPVNIRESEDINFLARHVRLNMLAEDPSVITALDQLLYADAGIFIKIDTGTYRTGISPDDLELIEACVDAIDRSAHLQWKGFLAHAGHTYSVKGDPDQIRKIYRSAVDILVRLKQRYLIRFPGIIVSFGDTPGASVMDDFAGIDELRPGNFVFYDLMQVQIGSCRVDDIAVAMVCPVVATHFDRQEAVIYGGGIHLSKEHLVLEDGSLSYGQVFRYQNGEVLTDDAIGYLRSLSQEHGVMRLYADRTNTLSPGDLVAVLPVHSCMTAHCMGEYYDNAGTRYDHYAGHRRR